MQIEDGKGSGKFAQVTKLNQLAVDSLSKPLLTYASENGIACGLTTPRLTLTTTEGRMLWLRNTGSTYHFHFSNFWFNWNGGNTNHNRVVECAMLFGDVGSKPTTNTVVSGAGNLNTESSKQFTLDVVHWDETGSGMTGGDAMQGAFYFTCAQGATAYYTDSSIVLGPGSAMAFDAKAEEAGEFSINIIGLYCLKSL